MDGETSVAANHAWDELSTIVADLGFLNLRFNRALDIARDIGASASFQSQVPYAEYENVSKRLRVWLAASGSEYPAFWDEIANTALEMSDTLVSYAYEGGDHLLVVADEAQQHLDAVLDEHCDKAEYSVVRYCE